METWRKRTNIFANISIPTLKNVKYHWSGPPAVDKNYEIITKSSNDVVKLAINDSFVYGF